MKAACGTGRTFLWLSVIAIISCAPGARGTAVPAGSHVGKVPDVAVWNETGVKRALWEELRDAGTGPVIVLPVYTRCTASCPTLIRKLEREVADIGDRVAYRVLIFSFDATENAKELDEFRRREGVPSNWLVVRAEEPEVRRFFAYFRYAIMTEGDVLIHPNETFLLDRDLVWRATFVDVNWTATELAQWIRLVESPGIHGWVAMHPDKVAWAGFSGMLLGVGVCVGWLMRRKLA